MAKMGYRLMSYRFQTNVALRIQQCLSVDPRSG